MDVRCNRGHEGKAKRCFLEPPVNEWPSYKLAKLPLYDPCKAYFDAVTELSKETIRHSTQLKKADGQEIHNLIEKFAESSLNLEDRLFLFWVFVFLETNKNEKINTFNLYRLFYQVYLSYLLMTFVISQINSNHTGILQEREASE